MARLEFSGARYVRNYHLAVPHHELVIDEKKSLSKKPSLEDNLIIHGDNLKALKSLLPHYAGKIKCIYIDPPYNTGNEEWRYNDNVSSPRHKEWLGKVVDKECLDRHDRWLSMMMPRLKLLRELMREDGVIFISIDDNEQQRLRMLLDEIFGEVGFIASIVWQKRTSPDSRVVLGPGHEYVLVYSKQPADDNESLRTLALTEAQQGQFKNPDSDPNGPWVSTDFTAQGFRPNQMYVIVAPGGKRYNPPDGRCWGLTEPVYKRLLKEGRMWFGSDNNGVPRRKTYLSEREGSVPWTWWPNDEAGHNQEAKKEAIEILGSNQAFDTPKPVRLIKRILQIACSSDSLILDSFAGSGTTAHAVLALNKEDGGNRKFILVEQEDYADTITAQRVRRVMKGVKTAKDENLKQGLGGSFTYVTLGEEYNIGKILSGKSLPKYEDMAAYVFQTATGETLDRKQIDKKKRYIGSSKFYDVYLFYEPDVKKLKSAECALSLDFVESLPKNPKKKRLVFGAVRYVNQETLTKQEVEFSQLPYEVYRRIEDGE